MKRLLLVDGSSYLYRAFHAMPDLRNRAGEPTGAIYGVVNMLRRLRSDYSSDYMACVFDAPGKTFRDEAYAQYKANRASMPEELRSQIPPIHEITEALGWPILMEPGIEADDVIGTLAAQAIEQGFDEVVVSTGDKDMAQLVNDKVTLIDTMKGITYDRNAVFDKFGVKPDQIVDYLTLVGDTVDNIPGVEKCGPKTAAKWLAEYDTLENLIEHAGEIKGKVGENLRAALDWLPQAKFLVTIKLDCEFEAKGRIQESLVAKPEHTESLKKLFQRYEFKTWFRQLGGVEHEEGKQQAVATEASSVFDAPSTDVSSLTIRAVQTPEELQALMAALDKAAKAGHVVCFDTETTSLEPLKAKLVGLSFALKAGEGYY
ncbi:MAG: 5'-3' exonuclease H3TH domain-containing protein, partial [Limnobacter sp.]|nr:5'-3' exonuclease H3TH domain-containing protein [Limnobacter sp.]